MKVMLYFSQCSLSVEGESQLQFLNLTKSVEAHSLKIDWKPILKKIYKDRAIVEITNDDNRK